MTLAAVQPSIGIQPDHVESTFWARGGNVCEGYVYPLAILQHAQIPDGITFDILPGSNTSVWANVSAATAQANNEGRDGRWVLALESALDDTTFKGLVKGIGRAVVTDLANATIPTGRMLWAAPITGNASAVGGKGGYHLDSQALTGTGGVARKTIAQALETFSSSGNTPSDGTTMYVYFDGFDGMGFSGETQ